MDPDAGKLKAYEREILRARSRVDVADLDNEIDILIEQLIGKLTKAQHKHYQAARLQGLVGQNPEIVIFRRAYLLGIDIKGITAPDILTLEEVAELVVIMREIASWLRACQEAGETEVSFQSLVVVAEEQATKAFERFYGQYQRYPKLDDLPESLMKLPRARSIRRLADKTGTLLPPKKGQE
jgi:hypothetical protein